MEADGVMETSVLQQEELLRNIRYNRSEELLSIVQPVTENRGPNPHRSTRHRPFLPPPPPTTMKSE